MSYTYVAADLRRSVVERAGGRCEYCLIPDRATFAALQIDHIVAEKHGGTTASENLALACALCNKCKSSDIAAIDPVSGEIVALYNPRLATWQTHFELRPDGRILGKTPEGRATARLLRFEDTYRVEERRLLIEAGELTT